MEMIQRREKDGSRPFPVMARQVAISTLGMFAESPLGSSICLRRTRPLPTVPELLGYDDGFLIVQMTIVTRPFVLDCAGAFLDQPTTSPTKSSPNGRPRSWDN